MYTSPAAVIGASVGVGGLAFTGVSVAWYVLTAVALLVVGLLFIRFGRRRAASTS